MRPFEPMRNIDGLSNEYTDNLVRLPFKSNVIN
jgi:hypothetical protein